MTSSGESFGSTKEGSLTFPKSAGGIRKGDYMLIKDNPCKVLSVSVSKTGKHGHAKCAITGTDIFTGKKCEDSVPSSHNVDCPNVSKTEYELVDVGEDNFLTLMDIDSGETREDLKLSDHKNWEEVNKNILEDFENLEGNMIIVVTVLKAMGQECVISHRKVNN